MKGVIFILIAKIADGTFITLSIKMQRAYLREWRQSTTFLCPQCNEKVYLKVGEINRPHFAHGKKASCSASFSEGESLAHIQGKEQLFNLLIRLTKDVKLEPYFKELAQRPDLLVTTEKASIPIEFQCSTISISQIEIRTAGYENAGMNPVWLLHTPEKLKKIPQGVQKVYFSRFEESFFTNTYPEGLVLLTYDPQFERFHYFSTLQFVVGKQYIGTHRILPITKQIFPFARPKNPSSKDFQRYFYLFKQMRRTFLRASIFTNRKGINNPFLRKCYELRIIPSELPTWIGIPIPFQNPFFEHPCEWQLAFVYYVNKQRSSFQQITIGEIRRFVQRFEGSDEKQVEACVEYRDFLLASGIESVEFTAEVDNEKLIKHLLPHYLQSGMKIEKM